MQFAPRALALSAIQSMLFAVSSLRGAGQHFVATADITLFTASQRVLAAPKGSFCFLDDHGQRRAKAGNTSRESHARIGGQPRQLSWIDEYSCVTYVNCLFHYPLSDTFQRDVGTRNQTNMSAPSRDAQQFQHSVIRSIGNFDAPSAGDKVKTVVSKWHIFQTRCDFANWKVWRSGDHFRAGIKECQGNSTRLGQ